MGDDEKLLLRSFIISVISAIFAELIIHFVFKIKTNSNMEFYIPLGTVGIGVAIIRTIDKLHSVNLRQVSVMSTFVCITLFLIACVIPRTSLLVRYTTGNSIGAMGNFREVGGTNGVLIFVCLFMSGYALCLAIVARWKAGKHR